MKSKIKYHKKDNLEGRFDPSKMIKCISCKKKIKTSESYQSRFHFSSNGVWACLICKECYEKEKNMRY
jgi:hypothetical protein